MKKAKKPNPSCGRVKKHLFKLLTLFIIVVLIFTGTGIFYARDLVWGNKYYKVLENQNITIGYSRQENLVMTSIEEFLNDLEKKGYYIAGHSLDYRVMSQKMVIHKSKINNDEIKHNIISSLSVDVFGTKLKLKDDNNYYYFKTENECSKYVAQLNKYIQQTVEEMTSEIISYKDITTEEVLNEKMNEVIAQKQKNDEAAAAAERERLRSKQVTSRGGVTSRHSDYKGGAPLSSYVYISSYYGMRNGKMHTGVDFAANAGTPIYAWKSGMVTYKGWNGSYGNFVEIQHNDGTVSRYAHMSGYNCSEGQTVSKGQTIGYVGTTGNSTGNHLHFEIKVNGSFVNPLNYL